MKWTDRIRQAWASRRAQKHSVKPTTKAKNVGRKVKQKDKAKPYRRSR